MFMPDTTKRSRPISLFTRCTNRRLAIKLFLDAIRLPIDHSHSQGFINVVSFGIGAGII